MDSPLPLPATSHTSSIPRRRLERSRSNSHSQASESASGTAVVSRLSDTRNDQPRPLLDAPIVSLSTSEGEPETDVPHPGLRLRNLIARTDSSTRPAARNVPPPARKALSAPSVHESDLDSVSALSLRSNGKPSASNDLASVFSRAMRPPPVSPRRATSRSPVRGHDRQPRSTHSDDELFAHSTVSLGAASQAESFDRIRLDLERQMERSALQNSTLSSGVLSNLSANGDPLKSSEAISSTPSRQPGIQTSLRTYLDNALSKPKHDTDESDDQSIPDDIERPATPKSVGIRRNLGSNAVLEPFENLQSSPEKPRTTQPFPSTRPKFHSTTSSRRELDSSSHAPSTSGPPKEHKRVQPHSPDEHLSRQRTHSAPHRGLSPVPVARSRSPLPDEHDLRERERSWGKHHANLTPHGHHTHNSYGHTIHKSVSSENLHGDKSSSKHDVAQDREREWGKHRSTGVARPSSRQGAVSPESPKQAAGSVHPFSRHGALPPESPKKATSVARPHSRNGALSPESPKGENGDDDEEEEEELHLRERNWNSPRPNWSHKGPHPHHNRRNRNGTNGFTASDSEDTETETPATGRHDKVGSHVLSERNPDISVVQPDEIESDTSSLPLHESPEEMRPPMGFPQTPRVPGYWNSMLASTPLDGSGPQTPAFANGSQPMTMPPITPAPPGGWAATPGLKKGILKVRFDANGAPQNVAVESELAPQPNDSSGGPTPGDSPVVLPSVEGSPGSSVSAPQDAVTPSAPAPAGSTTPNKSVLRVVDALGNEVGTPTHLTRPVASSPRMTQIKQPLLDRIKEKLADIRSALPSSPNQSLLSVSADGSTTEDERAQQKVAESSEALNLLSKRMQSLRSEEEEHSQKLARLRQSLQSTDLSNLPSISKPGSFLSNLRFAIVLEVLFALFILWTVRARAQALYITTYYDPYFPALYANHAGFRLAAAAVGVNADWPSVLRNDWKQVPLLLWHYLIHRFWEWWTRGGWDGWSDNTSTYWVPT